MILGLEKYSPELNLEKFKVQYNAAVNRFLNFCFDSDFGLLPYPELPLEKDYDEFGKRIPYVCQVESEKRIYGLFVELERAEAYAAWLAKKTGKNFTCNKIDS